MNTIKTLKWLLTIVICLNFISCEDFVEIDPPDFQITRVEVFSSDETAMSAMTGIYNQLSMASFSNGSEYSVTLLAGLSGGNIKNIRETNLSRMEFQHHELTPLNSYNLFLWSSAYNMIYLTNSFLEGIENSKSISTPVKLQLMGEARFVRAFTYFYLVNLYGDVPIILTTDYRENQLVSRNVQEEVYQQIVIDLQNAIEDLGVEYRSGQRTVVNQYVAMALLSRVYLYLEEWEIAEELSSQVIAQHATYEIEEEINEVFGANSSEAIWQISPIGSGGVSTHTNEGNLFIIHPIFSFLASVQLDNDFVKIFQEQDKRLTQWIGYQEGMNIYYPLKYKIWNSNDQPITEYSMVLRLAEQYFIRAEARAMQNNMKGAVEDLDKIKSRAGVVLLSETNPHIQIEEFLHEIIVERRKELFAEWGHRWLDLKRFGLLEDYLGSSDPKWQSTDIFYPIPEEERLKNPNLSQNSGY